MRSKPHIGLTALANHPGWREKNRQTTNKTRPHNLPNRAADETDSSPSNDQRATWAEIGLLKFASETGQIPKLEMEDIVCDFLADLAHFCDRHRIDMQDQLRRAHGNYTAETQNKGEQI